MPRATLIGLAAVVCSFACDRNHEQQHHEGPMFSVLSELNSLVPVRLGANNAACATMGPPVLALRASVTGTTPRGTSSAQAVAEQLLAAHHQLSIVRDELVDGTDEHFVTGELAASALDLGQSVSEALASTKQLPGSRLRNAVDNLKSSIHKLELLCDG